MRQKKVQQILQVHGCQQVFVRPYASGGIIFSPGDTLIAISVVMKRVIVCVRYSIKTYALRSLRHSNTPTDTGTHTHTHTYTHTHTHTFTHTHIHIHTHTHTHIHTHIHIHTHAHILCMTNKLTQLRELLRKKLNEDT